MEAKPTHKTGCSKCGKIFPETLEFFSSDSNKLNGLTSWCRFCLRLRTKLKMRERRLTEPEKVRAEKERHRKSPKGRKWKKERSLVENQVRKARRLSLPYNWNKDLWTKCKRIWKFSCVYCGSKSNLVQDHFIPLSTPDSPGTVIWNIVPACSLCNLKKGSKAPDTWLVDKSLYTKITQKLVVVFRRFNNVEDIKTLS